MLTASFSYLGFINLLLALFNLVPTFPLDGGRVLRTALWSVWHGLLWATRVASGFGTVFGLFLLVSGVLSVLTTNSFGGLWQILIGFFIVSASRPSYQQLLIKTALRDHTVCSLMSATPITADIEDTIERNKWPATALRDILVPCDNTNTASGDMPVDKVFGQMVQKNQRKMMVARAGDLEGVVSLADLMSYLAVRQELDFPEIPAAPADHSRGNEKAR